MKSQNILTSFSLSSYHKLISIFSFFTQIQIQQTEKTTDQGSRSNMNDFDDGLGDAGSSAFGLVASGHDAIEELLALAKLHDKMHKIIVLVGILQR